MNTLLLLPLCLGLGFWLRRIGRLPEGAAATLNAVVLNVSLPALVLRAVHGLELRADLWVPMAMPWLLFGLSAGLFGWWGRSRGWDRRTVGCVTLLAGLGNTSFVGLPMLDAFYGGEAVGIGVLIDQAGTFLALATVGLALAARAAATDDASGWRQALGRVIRFPPFVALLVALALRPVELPEPVDLVLQRLGDTLTPLALISVGAALRFDGLRTRLPDLAAGLGFKLLLAPTVVLGLALLLGTTGLTLRVTVFEAAMAPMITAGIVAVEHDLDPDLAALLLGVGIPLSFLTLPGWWWLLQRL